MAPDTHFAPNSWEARDLRSMLHGFSRLGTLQESGPSSSAAAMGSLWRTLTASVTWIPWRSYHGSTRSASPGHRQESNLLMVRACRMRIESLGCRAYV